MHTIRPADLLPGASLDRLPAAQGPPDDAGRTWPARIIRGRALIFWDPARPGQKLDAIDTDQITPASDCVSESLETLDER